MNADKKENLNHFPIRNYVDNFDLFFSESITLTKEDLDKKKTELKNDPITNEEIKNILNIKSNVNERDTVSENLVIASEPEENNGGQYRD